jgi:hypothetical protein
VRTGYIVMRIDRQPSAGIVKLLADEGVRGSFELRWVLSQRSKEVLSRRRGDGNPAFNRREKLVLVVWEFPKRAQSLTITVHDFYWLADRNLTLSVHVQ